MQNPRWLLAVPLVTYLISYLYLALYHGKLWLWNTIIHEGGTLTLFQTTFYASHFLGHIPSLTVIALLLASWYKVLVPSKEPFRFNLKWLSIAFAFTVVCFFYSLWQFGKDETLSYLFLSQQSVTRTEPGGSFLLHLPSTLSLVILIPLFIAFTVTIFRRQIAWQTTNLKNVAITASFAVAFAFLITLSSPEAILHALSDPRYLAHSVRELATFPLTFFPIPLALWFASQSSENSSFSLESRRPLLILSALAIPLLLIQIWIPLTVGIGELAQKPTFADAPLPIEYLLASHYFEHVLDTIFFTMVCLAIIPWRGMKAADSSRLNKTIYPSFAVKSEDKLRRPSHNVTSK